MVPQQQHSCDFIYFTEISQDNIELYCIKKRRSVAMFELQSACPPFFAFEAGH